MSRTHIKTRIRIWHDDDTVVDLSDRVLSGPTLRGDIDIADWELSITFDNSPDYINAGLSLDPLDELSSLNLDGDLIFDPILTGNHVVKVEIDKGDGWEVWFDGYAGGDISSVVVSSKRNTVTFNPDGVTMPLKERNRIQEISYANRDLTSSLLRSILMDSGFLGRLSHIVIQDDPMVQVTEYITEVGTTWDALQKAVSKTGYTLASRYHDAGTEYNDGSNELVPADGFYLTLYDPQRTKTEVDYTWTNECQRRSVRHSIDDVRTWVRVGFEDVTGAEKRTPAAYNETSRDKYGIPAGDGTKLHRQAQIIEDNNSLIRTMEEAEKYRDFALHDLEVPTPNTSIFIDELWSEPKLHDFVEFQFADYTLQVGITGISIDLDPSKPWGETTFDGVIDRVIGLRRYWLGQQLTPEEVAKQRQDFLTGGVSRLPTPEIKHTRAYYEQGTDGVTYSAINVQWERVEAWWYSHTNIYVSIGDDKHFGQEPYATARGTYAVLGNLPAGKDIYIYMKHIPQNNMSPQGRT